MPNNDYANEPNQSRSEDIIQSILDNTEYDEAARSRIEYLLIELKNAIEGGGGGGGVTSYSPLTEKPKIDNHTLQAGNNTSSDLGLQTKLTFDSTPTETSTNPVTSGGVYTALGAKANSSEVYNKSAVDTALGAKANSSEVYNKSAVDTALGAKADKSTTYTKTEVDTALGSKQNTISDLSTIRSGAALGATAVQPVSGKGLSTNDYTNDEKSKLAGIEAQANKTTVDSTLSGTSTNPVQNKVVKSALDAKQATLTTAQLAAVNSGITSADVEQITINENNILSIPRTDMDKLPITFTTNTGGNLKSYTIFGNADKVGEQTVNLFDKSNADIRDSVYPDGTTGEVKTTSFAYTVTIQCEPSTTYTISKNVTARRRLAGYNTYPQVGDIAKFVTETYTTIGSKQAVTFTTTADTHYLLFFFSVSESTIEVLQAIIDSIQLELGSTMTDYEPYGYKIPITSGGVTTNIYCDSQLDKGDMLTYGETTTAIPTTEGNNTIDTTLTNKPIIWIKYE